MKTINNAKYFQNKECEYFPCHKNADTNNFSCLMCFCPLYRFKDCGGKPKWINDGNSKPVKDCNDCIKIHGREYYGAVMDKLARVKDEYINS